MTPWSEAFNWISCEAMAIRRARAIHEGGAMRYYSTAFLDR
jgi:hypothetical protein